MRPLRLLFLLFVLGIVIGCGDDDVAVTKADAGPSVTPASSEPAPGVLRVLVTGLDPATDASISVSGNDLDRKVTRDVDIPLPPGKYIIAAAAVGAGEMQGAAGFRPKSGAQEITLEAGKGATARIEYERVEPKISARAKPASPALASSIQSLTKDDATGRTTLVLSAPTPESMSWAVGDIALFPASAATPAGHFGKIVSTDGKTIVTEPASMQDVIEDGVFTFHRDLGPKDVTSIVPSGAGAFTLNICNTLTASLPASKGVASVALTVIGDLCFAPTVDFSLSFRGKLVPDVYFKVGAGVRANVTVEGAATIGVGIEIPIATFTFGHYTIWTGPVPWVITPEVTISVGASGQITAGVRAGMTAAANAWGGFSYDSVANRFSPFSGKDTSFGIQWPEPFATAQVKGYGGPELTLLVDEIAGPTLSLDGYVTFDVDFLRDPLWQLHAGVELAAGIATAKLINLEYTVPLFTYDKIIAQSTDTPPVAAKVGGAGSVADGSGIAVGPDDTIYTTAGDTIRAYKKIGPALWTYTGGGTMMQVALGADGTVYARDFGGVYYAIGANGAEKWKSSAIAGGGAFAVGPNALWLAREGGVTALSLADGSVSGGSELDAGVFYRGIALSKDASTVYVAETSKVHAVPTSGGAPTWTNTLDGSFTGGLAIGADGTIYLPEYVASGTGVGAVAADGTTKWTKQAAWYDQPAAPVVGADGTIYLCGTNPSGGCTALDPQGNVKWRFYHNEVQSGPPVLGSDGRLYVATDKTVRAFAVANGQQQWRVDLPPTSDPKTSPAFLSTKELVLAKGSSLYVYYAGTTIAAAPWPRGGGDLAGSGRAK